MELSDFPEVQQWMEGRSEFDLRSFLLSTTSVAQTMAVCELMWPEFVEYRGGVFLKSLFDEEGVALWSKHLQGDLKGVEATINHLHLWDTLPANSEIEQAAVSELALKMRLSWSAALKERFPGRAFEVQLADGPEEYGPTLTFFSV